MAIMNHQVSINVLGSDLIYAATTFAGTSEWELAAGRDVSHLP